METSWDSVAAMSVGSPAVSLDGSKFLGKFYFPETATASPFEAPPPPISTLSGSGKKARASPGSNPPRCQVEGCDLDLSNAKLYYSKHKVCPTHSKSPKVIVAGLHRRFCQQCSRFHPLSEFDEGKRSCRKRLAGHNKRRRKPPPGPYLPSCYGSNGGCESIMLDFSAYSRTSVNNSMHIQQSKQCSPATHHHSTAPHQRWCNSDNNPPPSHVMLQGSPTEVGFSSRANPPGECYTGGANFVFAFSLLSSQPLGSANKDSGMVSNGPEVQPTAPQKLGRAAVIGTPCSDTDTPCCVEGHESCDCSCAMPHNVTINQFSDRGGPLKLHMEVDYLKAYGAATQHMNWSL